MNFGGLSFLLFWNKTSIINDAIRSFLSMLDGIVYFLLGIAFQTVFHLANFQMSKLYEEMQTRIYVILGIFMLFKITISFMSYLVNPDKVNDKEQGVGKLATRIVTVLLMFLGLPLLFTVMTDLQNRLLPVLPRVIIGEATAGDFFTEKEDDVNAASTTMDISKLGDNIAVSVYRAFLRNSEDCVAGSTSTDTPTLADNPFASMDDALNEVNTKCLPNPDIYAYDYTPIVSAVVGAIMLIVMIGINIDVAIRSFKLLILRAIAPIAILSYVDPKSSKDGAFSKWVKMLTSTWLSLFINLGIVYLVVFIIQMLLSTDVWTDLFGGFTPTNPLIAIIVLIFTIVALLFFAMEMPKFICDALGLQNTSSFGKMLGMAAAGLGIAGGVAVGYKASRAADETLGKKHGFLNTAKNVGAGLFGGLGAGIAGAHAASSAKGDFLKASTDAMAKYNSRALAAGAAGSTFFGRTGSTLTGLFAGETAAAAGKRNIAGLEAQKSALETIKSRMSGEMVKQNWTQAFLLDKNGNALMEDVYGEGVTGSINYKDFMARKNAAAAAGQASFNIMTSEGLKEITMEDAERFQGLILKGNEDDYISRGFGEVKDSNGNVIFSGDKILAANIAEAEAIGLKVTNRDSVNGKIDDLSVQIATAKRENARNEQNDRFSGK